MEDFPKLIPLTKSNFSLVDEDDFERVSACEWHIFGKGYAAGRPNGELILLHRFIMNPSDGQQVDHKNHNGLDNRKCNLRTCTQKQNMANRVKQDAIADRVCTSQYKGVSFRPDRRRWAAYVGTGKKRVALGCYATEELAALAYNKGAVEMYGEFAKINIIL